MIISKILRQIILVILGGIIYVIIEILWRGYSHWTMFLTGMVIFYLIGNINSYFSWTMPLWKQMGIATIIITVIEFIVGCIVNLWLGWNIWHYDKFDILGQVCLPYCFLWYWLSLVGILLDDILRLILFNEKIEGYRVF